jgi:hypothetical protein
VSQRTNHIDIRQPFSRELVAKKLLELKFIKSENIKSDKTTKNTPGVLHDTTNIKPGHLNCWKEDVQTGKAKVQTEQDYELNRNI